MSGKRYYTIPDDGAPIPCVSCEKRVSCKDALKIFTPNTVGVPFGVTCRECVDADWLEDAQYMGIFDTEAFQKENSQ